MFSRIKLALLALMLALTASNQILHAKTGTSILFEEQNGLVVIEAENMELPSVWAKKNSMAAFEEPPAENAPELNMFTGDGYIQFTGKSNYTDHTAESVLKYRVKINSPGSYRFRWRARNGPNIEAMDQKNDSWLYFGADEESGSREEDVRFFAIKESVEYDLDHYIKLFIQNKYEWSWNSGGETHFNGKKQIGFSTWAEFKAPGIYVIKIAGRSKGHVIDRLILYKRGTSESKAKSLDNPETIFNDRPEITYTTPQHRTIAPGSSATIQGAATTLEKEIVKVELYLDGSKIDESTKSSFDFLIPSLSEGEHSYYVKAYTADDYVSRVVLGTISATAGVADSPLAITQPYIWLNADNGVFTDETGAVLGWKDLASGIIEQPQGGGSPKLVTRNADNKPAVSFLGDAYFDLDKDDKATSAATLFIAHSRDSGQEPTKFERIFSSYDENPDFKNDNKGLGFTFHHGSNTKEVPPAIYSYSGTEHVLNKISIGAHRKNYAQQYHGEISELILYDRALTPAETTIVQQYLEDKWSVVTYTVTFVPGSAGRITSGNAVQSVAAGTAATEPQITMNNIYKEHTGWDKTFDAVDGNLTVTAVYGLRTFPVTNFDLKKGHNLISLNIVPQNKSIATILQPISTILDSITDSAGETYTFNGTNWDKSPGDWDFSKGYLIKVSDKTTLPVSGPSITPQDPVTLLKGINIVAIPNAGTTEVNALTYFDSILTEASFIRDEDGKVARKIDGKWYNQIGTVKPRKSYVVRMKNEINFTFPQ